LVTASEAAESPLERPTGTILFSSIAPRGWDLYVTDAQARQSRRLTEHPALDYNATFSPDGTQIAFVSERDGNPELYTIQSDGSGLKRLTTEIALDDHPAWSPDGKRMAFASTRRPAETPGQAWTAIYVMNADGSGVQRVSPAKASDYSPAWSPQENWIAFASGSGKTSGADLYVMKPDGSGRRLVTTNGGWPSFAADGQSLYFHSQRQGKWGIGRVNVDGSGLEQITPADIDAFTPQTSADGKRLVATLRRDSHRQIEVMDLGTKQWTALTTEATDHWNPSLSPDGKNVVYHKSTANFIVPNVELWGTPAGTDLKLVRVAGSFPAFSPDHKRLALIANNFTRLDVMNLDGTGRKTLYTGKHRGVFSVSWSHQPEQIVFGVGASFQGPKGEVDLMAVQPDGADLQQLTKGNGNDAFPSFAPDGKQLVFRSGRDGNKNLYVMNRDGGGLRQLTQGKWTDTMAHWSPTGEWIAFASDRDGNFDIWLIHPDGSRLRKLIGGGGRNTHPHFAPDGRWIGFTSQRAGYSAEEIALPTQPQPYGDLFAIRLDGSGLVRLFHNAFEEGTPAWGPELEIRPSPEGRKLGGVDY
jgi:Tol biopolymer transport system component